MTSEMTMKKFRWFWAWNDAKEEAWLGEMAKQGWHFVSYSLTGHTFTKGEPADITYRLDYHSGSTLPQKDKQEYIDVFADAGWEHVFEYAGWHYFRTPTGQAGAPEIFTDTESRIAKYRRLLALLVFILCIVVATSGPFVRMPRSNTSSVLTAIYQVAYFFRICIILLLAAVTIRLSLHIRRLRRSQPPRA